MEFFHTFLLEIIKLGLKKIIEFHSCLLCETQFERNVRRDTAYRNNGYCSLICFRESGEFHKLQQITQLKNNGIDTTSLSLEEIYNLYRKLISDRNKSKIVYDKWKSSQIKNNGENFASNCSKRGHKTFRLNFLLDNNLIEKDKIEFYSEEEIQQIFIENFNSISKHGVKCKSGRLEKYSNDLEQYKQSYKDAFNQASINYVTRTFDTDHLSQEDFNKILEDNKNNRFRSGKKSEEELILWKISHFKNLGIDLEGKENEYIHNLFSSYSSLRKESLADIETNGYKQTKKGWFKFKHIDKEIFYRSSWEERVLEELDLMIKYKIVSDVLVPKAITYFYKFERNYFSDFEINFINGKTLFIEIKPFKQLLLERNVAKFKSANKVFSNFLILTENEIFSETSLTNFILNFIDGEFSNVI